MYGRCHLMRSAPAIYTGLVREPAPRDFVSFNMERRRVSSTATPGTPSSSFSHWSTRLRHHCRRPTRCTLRVTARYTRNAIHVLFALDGSRLMHLLSCRTPPTSAPFWRPRSRALGIPNIINVRPPRGNSRGRRAVPPRTFFAPGLLRIPRGCEHGRRRRRPTTPSPTARMTPRQSSAVLPRASTPHPDPPADFDAKWRSILLRTAREL